MFIHSRCHWGSSPRSTSFRPQLEALEPRYAPAVLTPGSSSTNPNAAPPQSSSAPTTPLPPGQEGQTGDRTFSSGNTGTASPFNPTVVTPLNATLSGPNHPVSPTNNGAPEALTGPAATQADLLLAQANATAQALALANLLSIQNALFAQQTIANRTALLGSGGEQPMDIMKQVWTSISGASSAQEEQEEPPAASQESQLSPQATPNDVSCLRGSEVEQIAPASMMELVCPRAF